MQYYDSLFKAPNWSSYCDKSNFGFQAIVLKDYQHLIGIVERSILFKVVSWAIVLILITLGTFYLVPLSISSFSEDCHYILIWNLRYIIAICLSVLKTSSNLTKSNLSSYICIWGLDLHLINLPPSISVLERLDHLSHLACEV